MSATPTYDTVVQDLDIDPERIAARPAWSFEVAERVRKHRKKVLKSATPRKRRPRPARTTPALAKQTRRPQSKARLATAAS